MNVYIWPREKNLTTSYHRGGGAVAVAETRERAVELVRDCVARGRSEWDDGSSDDEPWCPGPAIEIHVDGHEPEAVWIMPDAGCC